MEVPMVFTWLTKFPIAAFAESVTSFTFGRPVLAVAVAKLMM